MTEPMPVELDDMTMPSGMTMSSTMMPMDNNMTMIMEMVMTFQFTKSSTVLFDGWVFSTVGGLVGSMIGIFVLAFGYEALKFLRAYLLVSAAEIRERNKKSGDTRFSQLTILSKSHLIQTALYGIQVIISYFLMLIVMTYNAWLGLATVWGLVVGYLTFAWRTPKTNQVGDEPCCTE